MVPIQTILASPSRELSPNTAATTHILTYFCGGLKHCHRPVQHSPTSVSNETLTLRSRLSKKKATRAKPAIRRSTHASLHRPQADTTLHFLFPLFQTRNPRTIYKYHLLPPPDQFPFPLFAMTTSAAQDEFNDLIARNEIRDSKHPEDRHDDSDVSEPESAGAADDYLEKIDTDDELDLPRDMRSNYHMPSVRSEANTGPKGVIADAQAFEQAKKQARRFTWKKQSQSTSYNVSVWHDEKANSDDDTEDSFMRQWREARLKELQNVGERIRSRTNSPSRRIYGNMPLVDGEGYLDAVDKTASGTTVVVFIYNNDVCIFSTLKSAHTDSHPARGRGLTSVRGCHARRSKTQRHRPLRQDAQRRCRDRRRRRPCRTGIQGRRQDCRPGPFVEGATR